MQTEEQWRGAAHWGLPTQFDGALAEARVKVSPKTGWRMNAGMYAGLMRPITWSEMQRYLQVKQKNTAPGESDVRYAHIAYAPDNVLNEAIRDRRVFDTWRGELMFRTEKVAGDPDQLNKRPLKLQNVMRKMLIGTLKDRIW
jgi:hypothetical protein